MFNHVAKTAAGLAVVELSDLRGLAIGFYQEVWASLDHAQKILYRGVMMGSCGNLASVAAIAAFVLCPEAKSFTLVWERPQRPLLTDWHLRCVPLL
ncbi:Zinc finger protein 558 [Manis javanica]|nr:Zinc finger protein 558 [Manis javanica]